MIVLMSVKLPKPVVAVQTVDVTAQLMLVHATARMQQML